VDPVACIVAQPPSQMVVSPDEDDAVVLLGGQGKGCAHPAVVINKEAKRYIIFFIKTQCNLNSIRLQFVSIQFGVKRKKLSLKITNI
jgi:hypothetical protein